MTDPDPDIVDECCALVAKDDKERPTYGEAVLASAAYEIKQLRAALAAETERCATIAEEFTDAAHIAHDMKSGAFPKRSHLREAIAAAIRTSAPSPEPEEDARNPLYYGGPTAEEFLALKEALAAETERVRVLTEALDEILDYRGGAKSALEDEYVMARVSAVRASAPSPAPEPDADALKRVGWIDGSYGNVCQKCGAIHIAAKLSTLCKPCALTAAQEQT